MKNFKDFASFNNYIGLPKPLDDDIDIGYYNPPTMLLKSEPVEIDFYRISIKIGFKDNLDPNSKPITGVFFNSPKLASGWDVEPTYTGMYLQLSQKLINENRFLFKNYLDYGQHEALFLNDTELQEIQTIFKLTMNYDDDKKRNNEVILSYVHVLISLVESYYKRQFSTNPKEYNSIVAEFQLLLKNYYYQPANQLPTVQYFADKLGLTSNYLGDIIKHFTEKSAIESIHEFVIKQAKDLLVHRKDLNNAQIAFELGFEYPNYFAKFFKKHTNLSPTEYRKQFLSKK